MIIETITFVLVVNLILKKKNEFLGLYFYTGPFVLPGRSVFETARTFWFGPAAHISPLYYITNRAHCQVLLFQFFQVVSNSVNIRLPARVKFSFTSRRHHKSNFHELQISIACKFLAAANFDSSPAKSPLFYYITKAAGNQNLTARKVSKKQILYRQNLLFKKNHFKILQNHQNSDIIYIESERDKLLTELYWVAAYARRRFTMEMTKREFLTAVTKVNGEEMMSTEMINAMVEYAQTALVKMDVEAAKRKGHKTEKQLAEAAAKDAHAKEVAAKYLTQEPKTATDVMELMNADGGEYKVQAVSAILRRAVALECANVMKVKIPKRGEQNGYTAVEA